jgi:hypothetical protein
VPDDLIDGYPYHLAGDDAGQPQPVSRRVFDMAIRANARARAGVVDFGDQLVDATVKWRPAGAVVQLGDEADAADPARNKASDGTIGDERHQGEGNDSDHNPWVIVAGVGVVRARDITNDPALHLDVVAERIRAFAAAGRLPQVTNGGYVILNSRITKPDFSGWSKYTGTNPHVAEMHVSVSRLIDGFDSRATWGVFAGAGPAPAPTPPAPPAPAGWTGPDLSGRGATLRGQAAGQPQGRQSNGPRVAELQAFLNRVYPAYSHLSVDGWYGTQTAGVLATFAARLGIAGVDGLNVGPKLALALWRAGFDR